MAETYQYKGTTYAGGNGLTAEQVAAQYNPELKTGTSTATSSTPSGASVASTPAAPLPIVPVNGTVGTQNSSNTLNSPPVTGLDIQSLLAQNQQMYASYQKEQERRQKLIDKANQQATQSKNTLENFDVSLEGGIQKIMDKPIALEFQQGQQAALTRDAAFTRSSLARSYQASVDNLNGILQSADRATQAYQIAQQFGTQNAQLRMQYEQAQRTAQQSATQFAVENGITKPFYQVGSMIVNTATGKGYSTPEEFFKDAGVKDFGEAASKGLVQNTFNSGKNTTFTKIGEHYDENTGTMVDDYGFVNPMNKTIVSASGIASGGASNLGVSVGEINGLPSYDTASSNPGVNRPTRNNNPGNIKVSNYTKTFDGVAGVESTPAADGGNFLVFESPEAGMAAVGRLLQEGKSYQGVTAEKAIKAYSGGGYGASSVGLNPNQDFQSQISDPTKLQSVVQNILKNEGYKPLAKTTKTNEQTKISNAVNQVVSYLDAGKRQATKMNINSLINQGDNQAAAQAVIDTALNTLNANDQAQARGYYVIAQKISDIDGMIQEFKAKGGDTNIFRGTTEQVAQKIGATSNKDLAYIANRINLALADYIRSISGAAFTDTERQFYLSLYPNIKNNFALNDAKISSIRDNARDSLKYFLQSRVGEQNYNNLVSIATPSPEELLVAELSGNSGTVSTSSYAQKISNQLNGKAPSTGNADLDNKLASVLRKVAPNAKLPGVNY